MRCFNSCLKSLATDEENAHFPIERCSGFPVMDIFLFDEQVKNDLK